MDIPQIDVLVANEVHLKYVTIINDTIDFAAKARGTGIARRTDEYIAQKIQEGKSVIALDGDKFVGFCYIESWENEKYVVNSGLIVATEYRGLGIAKRIKKVTFALSRRKFPNAKIFGLTTGEQVMHMNTKLGYVPVPFSKLTTDDKFWAGCQSCINYDILTRTNKTKCLCTGMIFDPEKAEKHTYTIGIAGGAGYTAGELIRLLLQHPKVELKYIQSESHKGQPISSVHQDLAYSDMVFSNISFSDIDVLFLCMGHGQSREFLKQNNIPDFVRIIDLSNDFRLSKDADNYIYGLPELNQNKIIKAQYIANPGCFATAITLGLLPLAVDNLLPYDITAFGITGSTGAGQTFTMETHYSNRESNLSNYKIFSHQHLAEVQETLQAAGATNGFDIAFVPVRGCLTRGIIVNTVLRTNINQQEIIRLYKNYYQHHPFVHISDMGLFVKQVTNTNYCFIHIVQQDNKILISSVIDNLLKGASGQAVQNMNIMLGLDETTGLNLKGNYF